MRVFTCMFDNLKRLDLLKMKEELKSLTNGSSDAPDRRIAIKVSGAIKTNFNFVVVVLACDEVNLMLKSW